MTGRYVYVEVFIDDEGEYGAAEIDDVAESIEAAIRDGFRAYDYPGIEPTAYTSAITLARKIGPEWGTLS